MSSVGRAILLGMVGLSAVVVLGVAANSAAFPPPPRGEAVSVFVPPPPPPPPAAPSGNQDGEVTPGEMGAADLYIDDLAWYEIFFVALVVIFAVCLLTAPLVLLGLIRLPRWRRERPPGGGHAAPPGTPARPLVGAVEEALDRVEQGQTREAVVACWLLLERAADAAGSAALPHETTTEYAARLAGEQLVSNGALTRLAGLYRVARFSDHPVDPQMRAQARSALGVLQRELTGGARL